MQPLYKIIPKIYITSVIDRYYKKKIGGFPFYDDALLFNFERNLKLILDYILQNNLKLNLHTTNGLHARYINTQTAEYIVNAGFKTLRIGYESNNKNIQDTSGSKVSRIQLKQALDSLHKAGFPEKTAGVYLMLGLQGQSFEEIKESIKLVRDLGGVPKIVNFSPIPHTEDFAKLKDQYPIIQTEPLSHNDLYFNSLQFDDFQKKYEVLKNG